MATTAYILIETNVGKSREVAETLRGLQGVQTVDNVTGPYDIITVLSAADLAAVGDIVTNKIHVINGITRTVTCLTVGSG